MAAIIALPPIPAAARLFGHSQCTFTYQGRLARVKLMSPRVTGLEAGKRVVK